MCTCPRVVQLSMRLISANIGSFRKVVAVRFFHVQNFNWNRAAGHDGKLNPLTQRATLILQLYGNCRYIVYG